jgi:hypothetical protein
MAADRGHAKWREIEASQQNATADADREESIGQLETKGTHAQRIL